MTRRQRHGVLHKASAERWCGAPRLSGCEDPPAPAVRQICPGHNHWKETPFPERARGGNRNEGEGRSHAGRPSPSHLGLYALSPGRQATLWQRAICTPASFSTRADVELKAHGGMVRCAKGATWGSGEDNEATRWKEGHSRMTWNTNRAARLPGNWKTLRLQVKARANGQCQWLTDDVRCSEAGQECDHIINNDDHSLSNLQWLCSPHHHEKTLSEAAAAKVKRSRYREPMQHPGMT